MARYHFRFNVAWKKLILYKSMQIEDFLLLNTKFIELLSEETVYVTRDPFTGVPSQMQQEWSDRKAANLAQTQCIHLNMTWADEKMIELGKLKGYRSQRPRKLEAFLKEDEVKARLGNV